MSVFDKFRQSSESSACPSLAETLADPEFEREPATCEPCPACEWTVDRPEGQRVIRNITFWEDPYGNAHCAQCLFPPHLVMVRRVLVLVATHLPSHYQCPIEPGDDYDQVSRPDILEFWKRSEQRRVQRQREKALEAKEGRDNGY